MVEVSWGELIDKYTILQIKSNRIKDETKLKNVTKELKALDYQYRQGHQISSKLEALEKSLTEINERLWDTEDKIRDCEREQRFDDEFVDLARAVYIFNDKRAEIKRDINLVLHSSIVEEKSYKPYAS